jgi:hypothetical protein
MKTDVDRAMDRLDKSVAGGSPIGMYMLASHLYHSNGDPHRVTDLVQRAADAKLPLAVSIVGDFYKTGYNGFVKDNNLWLSTLTKAVELGDTTAMLTLGQAYQNVEIAFRDYRKAREFFERAAGSHNPEAMQIAMNALGKMYEDGLGVTKDAAQARKWYAKAEQLKPNDNIIAYVMP